MAPEPANPWSGLSSQAESGALELQSGVVEDLAGECNEVLGRVLAVRGKVDLVDSLAPPSNLGSSEALAERFNQKGRELREILDDHETILNDMMDTFIAAGKAYSDTDDDSALDIDRVDTPGSLSDRPGPKLEETTNVPGFVYPGLTEDGGGMPRSLHNPADGVEFESAQVHGEDPHSLSFERYESMQESFGSTGDFTFVKIAQAAADWRWLAGQLNEKFDDLVNKMISTQNSWRSPGVEGGAEAARGAVTAYGADTDKLVANMNLIGDNLEYASQWLSATWYEMGQWDAPGLDEGETTTSASYVQKEKEARRQAAIRAMEEAYLPGLELTDAKIAILPDPVPPTKPGQDGGNNGGNNNGGNGGGGTGGGGGGGGGGQNQQQQQQAALDQIGQQRQELLAAQRELETQAQQQRAALQQQQQALQQQSSTQPLMQAAQQGLQQLGQMGQQLSTAAQQALQQAGITGLPGMPALQDAVKNYQSALQKAGKLPSGLGGGAGGSSPAAPGGVKAPPAPNVEKAAKLFPRASVATGVASGQFTGVAAASTGQSAPMGGMPMGGGGAGGGAQGAQQKDHKRADYLDSTEWLEEGLGDPAIVAKPVVDQ
ncbi:hypothetical protein [Nocardia flavorosea]|uniref:hypothetical protein n=1 Tax=Nocardia flavorosea TaxID=53429 RepID=UPI002456E4CA|nr:hypothetical protein [Nocardia flavorosea]